MSDTDDQDGGSGGTWASPPAEAIEIDDKVAFEVTDLALHSARNALVTVAREIQKAEPRLVLVGDAMLTEAYATFLSFHARSLALAEQLDGVLKSSTTDEESTFLPGALAALGDVTGLLSMFKAEAKFHGRDITQDSAILHPLLAKALIDLKIPVAVPQAFTAPHPGSPDGLVGTLSRLAAARGRLAPRAGTPPPDDAAAVLKAAESFEAQVFGNPDSAVLPALRLGERIKALLALPPGEAETGSVVIASLRSVGAGGHVRTRKHLFTSLFTGDQISFSAGSAIAWYLHDLETGELVGAGVESETTRMRSRFIALPWQNRWVRS